jgi:hypothetical protein
LLIDKGIQESFELEEIAVSDDFPTDPQPIPVTLEAPIFSPLWYVEHMDKKKDNAFKTALSFFKL